MTRRTIKKINGVARKTSFLAFFSIVYMHEDLQEILAKDARKELIRWWKKNPEITKVFSFLWILSFFKTSYGLNKLINPDTREYIKDIFKEKLQSYFFFFKKKKIYKFIQNMSHQHFDTHKIFHEIFNIFVIVDNRCIHYSAMVYFLVEWFIFVLQLFSSDRIKTTFIELWVRHLY